MLFHYKLIIGATQSVYSFLNVISAPTILKQFWLFNEFKCSFDLIIALNRTEPASLYSKASSVYTDGQHISV